MEDNKIIWLRSGSSEPGEHMHRTILSAIPWDKLSDILVGIRSISLTQDREYENETRDSNDRSKS